MIYCNCDVATFLFHLSQHRRQKRGFSTAHMTYHSHQWTALHFDIDPAGINCCQIIVFICLELVDLQIYIQRHLPPETWCAIFRPAESAIVNNNTINIWQNKEITRWAHVVLNLYDFPYSAEYFNTFWRFSNALSSAVAMNESFQASKHKNTIKVVHTTITVYFKYFEDKISLWERHKLKLFSLKTMKIQKDLAMSCSWEK